MFVESHGTMHIIHLKINIVIDGTVIKKVKIFTNPSQIMNEKNTCDDEIMIRKETAWNIFHKMKKHKPCL